MVPLQNIAYANIRVKKEVYLGRKNTDVQCIHFAPSCNTSPGLAGPVGSSYEDYSVTKDKEEKLIEVQ